MELTPGWNSVGIAERQNQVLFCRDLLDIRQVFTVVGKLVELIEKQIGATEEVKWKKIEFECRKNR